MAISASRLQFLLARGETFTARVQVALCKIAKQVLIETGVGATHAARANYATAVLNNPGGMAASASIYLASSTNVQGTIAMEDEGPRTSVTDAALESQISTDWSVLAGINTGS